ncbi:hypothetical protein SFK1770_2904 [Shigella flexneri K-1770]|nr:hypothetical protein SFK1770_2904 [Shigella flexneri K-1770]
MVTATGSLMILTLRHFGIEKTPRTSSTSPNLPASGDNLHHSD